MLFPTCEVDGKKWVFRPLELPCLAWSEVRAPCSPLKREGCCVLFAGCGLWLGWSGCSFLGCFLVPEASFVPETSGVDAWKLGHQPIQSENSEILNAVCGRMVATQVPSRVQDGGLLVHATSRNLTRLGPVRG